MEAQLVVGSAITMEIMIGVAVSILSSLVLAAASAAATWALLKYRVAQIEQALPGKANKDEVVRVERSLQDRIDRMAAEVSQMNQSMTVVRSQMDRIAGYLDREEGKS